jgi:ABC-2 type transport system ATP-binding protein
LIILDEPFSGLDPLNVQLMKDILHEQRKRGAAVVFSTHQLPDVEELCERVLLINEGKTLLHGRLSELKRARGTRSVRIIAARQPDNIPGVLKASVRNGSLEYVLDRQTQSDAVMRAFLDAGIPVEKYEVALPSLNEIFIEEVQRARGAQ